MILSGGIKIAYLQNTGNSFMEAEATALPSSFPLLFYLSSEDS